jgi:hypothetical protein
MVHWQGNMANICPHTRGAENTDADSVASKVFDDQTEWKLDSNIILALVTVFGKPDIDMFASRLNYQITPYIPRVPVMRFTQYWSRLYIYACHPFSLIPQTLQNLEQEEAKMLMIAPCWLTQYLSLITRNKYHSTIQHWERTPSGENTSANGLLLVLVRKSFRHHEISERTQYTSLKHGERKLKNNIKFTLTNGTN